MHICITVQRGALTELALLPQVQLESRSRQTCMYLFWGEHFVDKHGDVWCQALKWPLIFGSCKRHFDNKQAHCMHTVSF